MDRRSHYDALGVSGVGASTEDIKRAYKSLALTLHPDRPGGDADAFVRVSRAWEVLRDADARRAYDSVLLSRRRDVVVSDEIDIEDMDGEEVPSGSDSEGEGGGRRRWHAHRAIRASVSMRGCLRGDQRRATSGFRRRGRPVRELFPLRARQLRRRGAPRPAGNQTRRRRRMTRATSGAPVPAPVVAPAGRNSTHPLLITAPRSAVTHTSIYSRHRTIEASENRPRERSTLTTRDANECPAPTSPSFPRRVRRSSHPQLEPGSSPPPLAKFAASTTDDGSPDDASPSSVSSWYSATSSNTPVAHSNDDDDDAATSVSRCSAGVDAPSASHHRVSPLPKSALRSSTSGS